MKRILPLTLFFSISLVLSSCNKPTPTSTAIPTLAQVNESASPIETVQNDLIYPAATKLTLEQTADEVMFLLNKNNLTALSLYVHPERGVRFSPYPYINQTDLIFTPNQVAGLSNDATVYTWGIFDGSGEPIEMTFTEYFARFVYSADFADAAIVAINKFIGSGNMINNLPNFYSGADFVEYHFSGFEVQYEGKDWQSLRLVFIQQDGVYYLIGIVHAEWTI